MSEAEQEGAAAQLAQLRWQISRDAQKAEQLRERLPRLRTDVFKASNKLDEYQRKHGG